MSILHTNIQHKKYHIRVVRIIIDVRAFAHNILSYLFSTQATATNDHLLRTHIYTIRVRTSLHQQCRCKLFLLLLT